MVVSSRADRAAEPVGFADGLDVGNEGVGEGGPTPTTDLDLKNPRGLGLGVGGDKPRHRFCSQLGQTHMVFALAYVEGPPCLGRRKQALMKGSCGWAAGSHLFCSRHQRPEEWLSSPEGHDHPSWSLQCREARSQWPEPMRGECCSPHPSRHDISGLASETFSLPRPTPCHRASSILPSDTRGEKKKIKRVDCRGSRAEQLQSSPWNTSRSS